MFRQLSTAMYTVPALVLGFMLYLLSQRTGIYVPLLEGLLLLTSQSVSVVSSSLM